MANELKKLVQENIEDWASELIKRSRISGQMQLNYKLGQRNPHIAIDYELSMLALDALLRGDQSIEIMYASEELIESLEEVPQKKFFSRTPNPHVQTAKLLRSDREKRLDAGLETIYLTLGWVELKRPDGLSTYTAPLAVLPVRLEIRSSNKVFVSLRDDATPMANLGLSILIAQDYEIEFPDPTNCSDLESLNEFFQNCHSIVEEQGWRMFNPKKELVSSPSFSFINMTFQLEAIYKDILDNREILSDSELIQALVDPTGSHIDLNQGNELISKEFVDDLRPPEEVFDISTSDSSQRVCIDAAVRGLSFTIDGPPGTGKTQTITNILTNVLQQGKSVLFVADKATALKAVYDNLAKQNLDKHVVSLVADKAQTRSSFAKKLEDILSEASRDRNTAPVMSERSINELRRARMELNENSSVFSQTHPGFGLTYSNLIGLATQSEALPLPSLPENATLLANLKQPNFVSEIREYVEALAQIWQPVDDQDRELWFRVSPDLTPADCDKIKFPIQALERILENVADLNLGISVNDLSDLQQLVSVLDGQTSLKFSDTETIGEILNCQISLSEVAQLYASTLEKLAEISVPVENLEVLLNLTSDESFTQLLKAHDVVSNQPLESVSLNGRISQVSEQKSLISDLLRLGPLVAQSIGLSFPQSWADVISIKENLDNGERVVRPSNKWFHPTRITVAQVQELIDSITPWVDELASAEAELINTYGSISGIPNINKSSILRQKVNLIGRLSKEYKTALENVRKGALVDVDQDRARSIISAFERRSISLSRLISVLKNSPLLDSYDLKQLREYQELIMTLKQTRAALSDVGNNNNSLLFARRESAVFYENSTAGLNKDTEDFNSAATVLASIAQQSSDPFLRYILGNLSLQDGLDRLIVAQRSLEDYRDCIDVIKPYLKTDNLSEANLFVATVRDLALMIDDTNELKRNIKSPSLRLWDTKQLSLLHKFIEPISLKSKVLLHLPSSVINRFVDMNPNDCREIENSHILSQEFIGRVPSLSGSDTLEELLHIATQLVESQAKYRLKKQHFQFVSRAIDYSISEEVNIAVSSRISGINLVSYIDALLASQILNFEFGNSKYMASEYVANLESRAEAFRRLDQQHTRHAANQVANTLFLRALEISPATRGQIVQNARLRQNHPPIERQIANLGSDLTRILPVVLATPLNVSRYIPASVKFDYVIFDEASQMYPAFALASLYRARAAIVAGDDKQMPPPRHPGTISSYADDYEDLEQTYDPSMKDFESLLDLSKKAPALLGTRLLWHYRSRNEGLIAFSNQEFYRNELYTFPSRAETDSNRAVKFVHVPDGKWTSSTTRSDSGRKIGINTVEAQVVASAVKSHALAFFDSSCSEFGKSLMVIAMSKAQAEEIDRHVQLLAEKDKILRKFIEIDDPKNSFRIINLENVQGDERDYVFISFQYNSRLKDDPNRVRTMFGPLTQEKGWRRLNVAITRARYEMKVFCSFKSSNIPENCSEAAMYIKRFLAYAEIGPSYLNTRVRSGSSGFVDSPFELEVLEYVQSLGYECSTQVGSSGYKIDIAVKHKRFPDVYMLAIECDGFTYHSSKAARDRDAIRQSVLEGLGWTFHRIWGTRWYRLNDEEKMTLKIKLERLSDSDPFSSIELDDNAVQESKKLEDTPDETSVTGDDLVTSIFVQGAKVEDENVSDISNSDSDFKEQEREGEARVRKFERSSQSSIDKSEVAESIVSSGLQVTVHFPDFDDTETFFLGSLEDSVHINLPAYTPTSPIGAAVMGQAVGAQVSYEIPNGKRVRVHIVSVEEILETPPMPKGSTNPPTSSPIYRLGGGGERRHDQF